MKKKKNKYIDFRNNEWQQNYLVGQKIVRRPWKRIPLIIAGAIFLTGLLPIMNFIFSTILANKFLVRFG